MKKVVAVAAVLVVLGVPARRFGAKMPAIDWEKRLEAMPDNARDIQHEMEREHKHG